MSAEVLPSAPRPLASVTRWEREADVVIIGHGGAGAFAAIEAARALGTVGTAENRKALDRALESWTKFFEGKVPGSGPVAFSDWQRALRTLDALVEVKGRRRVGAHRPARLFRVREEHPYLLKERGILFPF